MLKHFKNIYFYFHSDLFGGEDQDYRSGPAVPVKSPYHSNWAKFRNDNPDDFKYELEHEKSKEDLVASDAFPLNQDIDLRSSFSSQVPTSPSETQPNVNIPSALTLENREDILTQIEVRRRSGELSHEQHQEILKQLSKLDEVQKKQQMLHRSNSSGNVQTQPTVFADVDARSSKSMTEVNSFPLSGPFALDSNELESPINKGVVSRNIDFEKEVTALNDRIPVAGPANVETDHPKQSLPLDKLPSPTKVDRHPAHDERFGPPNRIELDQDGRHPGSDDRFGPPSRPEVDQDSRHSRQDDRFGPPNRPNPNEDGRHPGPNDRFGPPSRPEVDQDSRHPRQDDRFGPPNGPNLNEDGRHPGPNDRFGPPNRPNPNEDGRHPGPDDRFGPPSRAHDNRRPFEGPYEDRHSRDGFPQQDEHRERSPMYNERDEPPPKGNFPKDARDQFPMQFGKVKGNREPPFNRRDAARPYSPQDPSLRNGPPFDERFGPPRDIEEPRREFDERRGPPRDFRDGPGGNDFDNRDGPFRDFRNGPRSNQDYGPPRDFRDGPRGNFDDHRGPRDFRDGRRGNEFDRDGPRGNEFDRDGPRGDEFHGRHDDRDFDRQGPHRDFRDRRGPMGFEDRHGPQRDRRDRHGPPNEFDGPPKNFRDEGLRPLMQGRPITPPHIREKFDRKPAPNEPPGGMEPNRGPGGPPANKAAYNVNDDSRWFRVVGMLSPENTEEFVIDGRPYEIMIGKPSRRIRLGPKSMEVFADPNERGIRIDGRVVYRFGDFVKDIKIQGDTHKVFYHGQPRLLWIDGILHELRSDAPPKIIKIKDQDKTVKIDGRDNMIIIDNNEVGTFGGPMRFVFVDNNRVELTFEPPPRKILIDGKMCELKLDRKVPCVLIEGKPHGIRFDGPPRDIHINDIPYRAFMDRGTKIRIGNKPCYISFGGPAHEVIMDGRWFEVKFGGPPKEIKIGNRDFKIQLKGPPPDVKILNAMEVPKPIPPPLMSINAKVPEGPGAVAIRPQGMAPNTIPNQRMGFNNNQMGPQGSGPNRMMQPGMAPNQVNQPGMAPNQINQQGMGPNQLNPTGMAPNRMNQPGMVPNQFGMAPNPMNPMGMQMGANQMNPGMGMNQQGNQMNQFGMAPNQMNPTGMMNNMNQPMGMNNMPMQQGMMGNMQPFSGINTSTMSTQPMMAGGQQGMLFKFEVFNR